MKAIEILKDIEYKYEAIFVTKRAVGGNFDIIGVEK